MKQLLLPKARTSLYSIVCLTAGGVGAYGFGTDDQMQIGKLELRELFRTIDENRDFVKGLKSMVSVALGGEFLMLAKSVAHSARIPLVLHLGEFDDYVQWYPGSEYKTITPAVLNQLDRGDLITHCYTPEPGRMFDAAGTTLPTIRAMIERGVFLDLGHSSHGFDVEVARLALSQGIRPHTLGTDLHVSSVGPVMRSLADVMSKMLAFGLDLNYVVRMVTAHPAEFLQITDRAGTLRKGHPADVTVFEIQKGEYDWMDSHRNHFPGTERVVPLGCLKNGAWFPAQMDLVDTRANRSVAVWKTGVPPAAARLSAEQRAFLGAVADLLQQRPEWDQIDLHYAIEGKREAMGLSPRDGVNALHLAIYNKLAGQQVAWFLGKAKRDFIVPRLKAVAAGEAPAKAEAEVES
jgi:predicted amidohydrolase